MKKIVLVLVFVFAISAPAFIFAETANKASAFVDVGNKMCPVSGDKVSGKSFVEHEGKRYGLCCKMCADKFNKNPEKFIAGLVEGDKKTSESGMEAEQHHEH